MTLPRRRARRLPARLGRTLVAGLAVLAASAGLVLVAAAPASAGGMSFQTTSLSERYGLDWTDQISIDNNQCQYNYSGCNTAVTVSITGPVKGSFTTSAYSSGSTVYSGLFNGGDPLPVGSYTITATYTYFSTQASTDTPLKLTVTPAPIGIDLRSQLDPSNPSNAIITGIMTGDYVTQSGGEAGGPPIPAGTWHVVVKNAAGSSAFAKDVVVKPDGQTAGQGATANVYWAGVPAGSYTITADFAVASSSAAQFTVTSGQSAFNPPAPSASPTPTPSPTGIVPTSASTDGTLPFWVTGVGILLVVALAVGVLLVSLALRRRPAAAAPAAGEVPDAA